MTTQLVGLDGGVVQISADALAAFKASMRGPVLGRDAAEYEEARKVWNAMIDRRPGLIARCSGTADVVQAVAFAREHKLLFSVRGGGHNIAGLAVCEGGLMLDMSSMRGVWVDPKARTARAQAGCLLGDLDRETQQHGLAAVLGFVSATGIAGLTVGGGFGYLTRRFGWTCDTLISVEVVTADGKVLRAAEDENADLFWALRGGSGNFGIVTSFEYRVFPVGPTILGGAVAWHAKDAKEVLGFFREFTAKAPRELTCVGLIRIAPPAPWLPKEVHGKPIVAAFVCYSGNDLAEGEKVLAPLRALGKPVADIVTKRPYTQMQSMLDATQPKGRRYYWKAHYLSQLAPKAIDAVIDSTATIPSPHSAAVFFQLQGALSELPAGHSPVGNRDAAFVFNATSAWDNAADDDVNVRWARAAFEAMQPFATGGTYVNFLNAEEGTDRVEAAYGKDTLSKLAALKKKYDPSNLFRHTKSVGALAST